MKPLRPSGDGPDKGKVVFLGKTKDPGPCITELSNSGQQRLETGPDAKTIFVKGNLLENKAVEKDSVLFHKYRKGFFCYLRNQILYSREAVDETA